MLSNPTWTNPRDQRKSFWGGSNLEAIHINPISKSEINKQFSKDSLLIISLVQSTNEPLREISSTFSVFQHAFQGQDWHLNGYYNTICFDHGYDKEPLLKILPQQKVGAGPVEKIFQQVGSSWVPLQASFLFHLCPLYFFRPAIFIIIDTILNKRDLDLHLMGFVIQRLQCSKRHLAFINGLIRNNNTK